MPRRPGSSILHATAVAVDGAGLLITGASGTGKSSLAIQLMALGASLVADDGVMATPKDGGLMLSAPDAIAGMIEARGIGLLSAPAAGPAWARLVVDLDATSTARLPEPETVDIEDVMLPLIRRLESPAFPAMVLLALKGGRRA